MSVTEVMCRLDESESSYDLLAHDRTERATDEATVLGVSQHEVGKTIVLVTPNRRVRAVIPASDRLDLHKVRRALGNGNDVRLATEDELNAAYPMFELGAVPPFGGPSGERVLIDERLAARRSIVVEAGTHHESIRLRTADLLRVTRGEVADLVRTTV